MKLALVDIFQEENPNEQYWNQLADLIRLMHENEVFTQALKLIDRETLAPPIRSKFTHFCYSYDMYSYYAEETKRMANAYEEENY